MGRKGKGTTLPKLVALGLVASLSLSCFGASPTRAQQTNTSGNSTYQGEYSSERLSNNYTQVSKKYTLPEYKGDNIVVNMAESAKELGNAKLVSDTKGYKDAEQVLDMTLDDTVSVTVTVPEDGQYFVLFHFLSYDQSILPVELSLQVDGAYPFYECRNLEFETYWAPEKEPSYDRYGNQIVTVPNKVIRWEEKYLMDSSYRHSGPLALELKKGEHTFTFTVNEGSFLLGNME